MSSHRQNMPPQPAPAMEERPAPGPRETGWLPACVWTGRAFEADVAFFADSLGRISRFSREPADLAAARRLPGQAALPGLVSVRSDSMERRLRSLPPGTTAPGLTAAAAYDVARMAFTEMLLCGITCAGEAHVPAQAADDAAEADAACHEILRAARDTGIRIALLRGPAPETPPDRFLRELDALREHLSREHPGDDAWLGVACPSPDKTVPGHIRAAAAYAHSHRLRLHIPVSMRAADNEACLAAHGRTPVALLAELGLVDKRFTAVHAAAITEGEARLLGAARATVCCCPSLEQEAGAGMAPARALVDAGAGIALGTGGRGRCDLMGEARLLGFHLRSGCAGGPPMAEGDLAALLLHAAAAAGARSLGAPSGALEVGRPADFFTVSLNDPAFAGVPTEALPSAILSCLDRRAVREVWVGARQRVSGGRHPLQGVVTGRFTDLQHRLGAKTQPPP